MFQICVHDQKRFKGRNQHYKLKLFLNVTIEKIKGHNIINIIQILKFMKSNKSSHIYIYIYI